MPVGAVYIGRPTKYGNPFSLSTYSRVAAVEAYRIHLARHPELVEAARRELAGRDLACFCPLDQPCHGDVLLELANGLLPAA